MLSALVLACMACAALGAQGGTLLPPRTLARLAGGHLKHAPDHAKNSFAPSDKDAMLVSGAGEGEEKETKKKNGEDEDKKTLADQVAEGKYGLIQKELFARPPARPGLVSYAPNPETESKDNGQSLGGLRTQDVWLAEDHLLVLRGGVLPEHGSRPGTVGEEWPPIDDYRAPQRQVKLPQRPEIPPPFPVRLSDGGPLVFLTPNGSVPAPDFAPPAGFGSLHPEALPYGAPPSPQGPYPGDSFAGPPPFPPLAFPTLPANLSDLYDEDDPSIYYPPPYSFSYNADNKSAVAAGPLVPGIVLPPPPDFFAPLDLPSHAVTDNSIDVTTTAPAPPTKLITLPPSPKPTFAPRPVYKKPTKVVVIPKPSPPRKVYTTSPPVTATTKPTTSLKPVEKKRPSLTIIQKPIKTTLKPVGGVIYEYPDKGAYLEGNSVSPPQQPFLIYGPPQVTSTPVPLRAYYNTPNYDGILAQIQFAKQNAPNTRIRPEFYSPKQNGKSVASFYFYEEPVTKASLTTPAPQPYYDDKSNYYQTVNENGQVGQDGYYYNGGVQSNFIPSSNLDYRPIPSREPSPFFFVPQRQGSRTLTQEYFSINQNSKGQSGYIQQQQPPRANTFYDQIANIQQTIDYYTTNRPKVTLYQSSPYREVRQKATPRPVYQFSYQNNNAPADQSGFRAPKMDPEPFRPMVSYSKPYNIGSEYSTTPKTNVVVETQSVTTEAPQAAKYYATAKPEDYDYDTAQKQNVERATNRPAVATPTPVKLKQVPRVRYGPTTKNPPNHAYYTKQEESLFDDITRNYFTIFGQKIENGNRDGQGLIPVTTPLNQIEASTVKTPLNNNLNIQYVNDVETNTFRPEQKPISLAGDTDVNYRQPRPLINPESEFIPIVNPEIQAKYQAEQQLKQLREQLYHKQRHNVEIIKSELINPPVREGHQFPRDQLDYYNRRPIQAAHNPGFRGHVAEGRPGSLIAYRLPGEGAHVYFLTPQPARPENYKYRTAEELAQLS